MTESREVLCVASLQRGEITRVRPTLDRLREMEWVRKEYGGGPGALTPLVMWECPHCLADRAEGHKAACKMAGLIQELERRAAA